MYKLVITLLTALVWSTQTLASRTVNNHITNNDLERFQKVFIEGLSSNDLQAIYYSSANIETTNAAEKVAICKKILALHEESKINEFEKDFYLIGANKNLRCSDKLPESLLSKIYASLKKDAGSIQEIYYRIATHKILGVKLDEAAVAKHVNALKEFLKKDESLAGFGYGFNVAMELGPTADFVADRVEDAIAQADEVDGRMLQFEGGLSITALVVNGAFRISNVFKKPSPITPEQAVKFANYFLSRRSVQTPKGAHVLIEALKTLNNAGKNSPISIELIGNGLVQTESPQLNIAVFDLFGKALSPAPQIVIGKILAKKDDSVLAEKLEFAAKSSDKTIFATDLPATKLARGLYVAEINVDSSFKQKLQFKVLGRVKVHSLEIGISDSDAVSSPKKHTVTFPNTFAETLQTDGTKKISMKTLLIDEGTTKVISVHQAFVRFYNKVTEQEIIYVAEQDSNKAYKFDMDVGARAGDFGYKSGSFELYLIIGDASLSNSFQWHVANLQIKFSQESKEDKKQQSRAALPEIIHQFRIPEKRPPRIVSDIFTGLCLTPLVLLFIFWSKLGINVSNFSFLPSTIGFHLGFGGILSLFAVFWWKLNMFETLRLLIPIAMITFVCGNRLLRRLYAQRINKTVTSSQ